jgi:hypothetical protein
VITGREGRRRDAHGTITITPPSTCSWIETDINLARWRRASASRARPACSDAEAGTKTNEIGHVTILDSVHDFGSQYYPLLIDLLP